MINTSLARSVQLHYQRSSHARPLHRYILRNGQVVTSAQPSEGLDVYCYQEMGGATTYMFLSDSAEVSFLMRCGEDLHVSYTGR